MKNLFVRFLKDDSGATAIEYGLIAAGISVAIIAVVNGLGTSLNAKFKSISDPARRRLIAGPTKFARRPRSLAGAFTFLHAALTEPQACPP